MQLGVGWPVVWLGLGGAVAALVRRAFWPLLVLLLPPAFYVWSMHSGGTPIFVPHLWPNTYYNTRYGLAALPLLAFAAGALVALVPVRFRAAAGLLVAGLALSPWVRSPRPEAWICWKESLVNSQSRRAWTKVAAGFLRGRYSAGTGIVMSFGDLSGILREAGIPLRESLHQENVPYWDAALSSPSFFLKEEWALTISGDKVADTVTRTLRHGPRYDCLRAIEVKGAPVIQIYRRK